jgi:hypothetical protein
MLSNEDVSSFEALTARLAGSKDLFSVSYDEIAI